MAGRRSDTKDTPYFDAWQFPDLLWREAVSYGKFPNENNTLLTSKRQCVSRARLPSHDACSMNEPMRDCLFGKRLFTSRQWRKKFPKNIFGQGTDAGSRRQRERKYASLLIALWLSTKNARSPLSEKDVAMNRSRQRMTCTCAPAGLWRVPARRGENCVRVMLLLLCIWGKCNARGWNNLPRSGMKPLYLELW